MDINILEYGAKADGKTLNTQIIQKAIDECHSFGGGRVIISGGTFLTGSIHLKSNVNLHIAADGILLGSPNCEDYPETQNPKHIMSENLPRWRNAALIFADECENIAITGQGTINCNGENFVEPRETSANGWKGNGWKYVRKYHLPTPPRAVFFTGCRNIMINDVTMINQPAGWSYWIHDSDYVTFDRVKIIANVNYPNNDGIHINCSRNVTVSNCSITCGDDCIVVRANSVSLKENKICEKVTITNCNLTSYSAGIRIGWINDGSIRNCVFSNIVMTDCTSGISINLPYIKPDRNNPNSADIGREETLIENLSFDNIIMDKNCSFPINIRIDGNDFVGCKGINNIYFNNIHVSSPELPQIIGRKNCPINNVQFNNCTFYRTDGSEFEDRTTHGAFWEKDGEYRPMYFRYVKNLRLINTTFDS